MNVLTNVLSWKLAAAVALEAHASRGVVGEHDVEVRPREPKHPPRRV